MRPVTPINHLQLVNAGAKILAWMRTQLRVRPVRGNEEVLWLRIPGLWMKRCCDLCYFDCNSCTILLLLTLFTILLNYWMLQNSVKFLSPHWLIEVQACGKHRHLSSFRHSSTSPYVTHMPLFNLVDADLLTSVSRSTSLSRHHRTSSGQQGLDVLADAAQYRTPCTDIDSSSPQRYIALLMFSSSSHNLTGRISHRDGWECQSSPGHLHQAKQTATRRSHKQASGGLGTKTKIKTMHRDAFKSVALWKTLLETYAPSMSFPLKNTARYWDIRKWVNYQSEFY